MANTGAKRNNREQKRKLCASLFVSGVKAKEIAKKVGVSYSTIRKWLSDPEIKEQIAQKTEQLEQKNEAEIIKKSDNLIRLNNIMDFDPGEFYDEFGNLLPIHRMSKRARMMISEINHKTVTIESADGTQLKNVETEKIKWHGLPDALKESNRMQPGHLAPRVNENTGKDGGPIEVENVTQHTPEQIETMQQIGKAIVERLK